MKFLIGLNCVATVALAAVDALVYHRAPFLAVLGLLTLGALVAVALLTGKRKPAAPAEAPPPPRAVLYLRVSTGRQHNDNQRPALEELARARGYELVHVYEEVMSGAKRNRPAWRALKEGAHRRAFDVVLVAAIDRIGRNMVGNIHELLEVESKGVTLVSLREPWLEQKTGPTRDLLVAIFSWVAEEERKIFAERSKAGVERARREGKRLGRPPVGVNVAKAQALLEAGKSERFVARQLGIPRATLQRALRAREAK